MSNRTSLKSHFRTGDIPTQENFYDFIDSVLNKDEDGLTKKAGSPISIQAEGDVNSVQNLLFFYRNLNDENPSWKINQNPRTDPQNAATNKPGLTISDGASGASRFYIRSADGNVGLGTIEPAANLHIKGSGTAQVLMGEWKKGEHYAGLSLNGVLDPANYNLLSSSSDKTFYLSRPQGADIRFRIANADQMTLSSSGSLGIGTTTPQAKLHVVGGAIQPQWGNTPDTGIQFPNDPGGGGGDTAWIRFYPRPTRIRGESGEGCTLEIGISNDGDDHIALMASGNVGVGTLNPMGKLHVQGSIFAGTSDIYFTDPNHQHTGIGNTAGYAAIENSTGYNALMLLGRAVPGGRRKVIVYDDLVVAGTFTPSSDRRIKKEIRDSKPAEDLALLNQLQVRDYRYQTDETNEGGLQKGFIAQEVEAVLPDAVVKHSDFVPDIFSPALSAVVENAVLKVTLREDHGLETGDRVRLVTPAGTKEVDVVKTGSNAFAVDDWTEETDHVFVYGKMVHDFRSLNYNAVFSLGISAVQELWRQLQQIKEELAGLKEKRPRYTFE